MSIPRPKFQLGAGIDLYGYKGEDYFDAAGAEATYLTQLNANSVIISFPFFMHGAKARGVYAKYPKTPTPGDLAEVVRTAETAACTSVCARCWPITAWACPATPGGRSASAPGSPATKGSCCRTRGWPRPTRCPKLFVGTEFQDFGKSSLWNQLDKALRRMFKGALAYANNGHLLHRGTGGRLAAMSADSYPDMPQMAANAYRARLTNAWKAWDAVDAPAAPC